MQDNNPTGTSVLSTLNLLNDDNEVVGSLSLFKALDGSWKARVSESSSEAQRIQGILNKIDEPDSNRSNYLPRLIAAIEEDGLRPQVAEQVISGQFKFDSDSGAIIGTFSPIFETEGSGSLQKRLLRAVEQVFTKTSSEELSGIETAIAGGDAAAVAQALNSATLIGYTREQRKRLFDAYRRVDLAKLDGGERLGVLRRRLALAAELKEYEIANDDAAELLRDHAANIGREGLVEAQTVLGIYSALSDRPETALARFRQLLAEQNISSEQRAWLWRNVSLTLNANDPESANAARLSADAFLQNGWGSTSTDTFSNYARHWDLRGIRTISSRWRRR